MYPAPHIILATAEGSGTAEIMRAPARRNTAATASPAMNSRRFIVGDLNRASGGACYKRVTRRDVGVGWVRIETSHGCLLGCDLMGLTRSAEAGRSHIDRGARRHAGRVPRHPVVKSFPRSGSWPLPIRICSRGADCWATLTKSFGFANHPFKPPLARSFCASLTHLNPRARW